MMGLVEVRGTYMSPFLGNPSREAAFWKRLGNAVFRKTDLGVSGRGNLIYKKIIITRFDIDVFHKAIRLQKQRFSIGHISANPHVWQTGLGKREILNGNKKCFVANEFIE